MVGGWGVGRETAVGVRVHAGSRSKKMKEADVTMKFSINAFA